MKPPIFTNPPSALAVAITALIAATSAQATIYTFKPSVTVGDWQTGSNWNGSSVPASSVNPNAETIAFIGSIIDGPGASGGINKTGTGRIILATENTFSATTLLTQGTIQLNDVLAWENSTVDTGSSGTRALVFKPAGAFVLGALAGSLDLVVDSGTNVEGITGARGLNVGQNDATTTYRGVLSGDAALTKAGAGRFTLTGANTYVGSTLVSAGSLFVNNTTGSGTGSGAVTVASGATLGGSGTLGGATSVFGIHAPGATLGAVGTETFSSSLTYNSGSTFKWDLSGSTLGSPTGTDRQGSYDQVVASGALSVISGAIFEVDLTGLTGNGSAFSGSFWDSHRTWSDVFSGSGVTSMDGTLFSFSGTDGNGLAVAIILPRSFTANNAFGKGLFIYAA